MDRNNELQLEVLRDWYPDISADTMRVFEDGSVTLNSDVSSFLERVTHGRVAQRESRTSSPQPQSIAGILVIYRREADMLPLGPARSVTAESWAGVPTRQVGPAILLSAREIEVLSLIAAGQSNQEIAEQLCLALNTVKRHAYNIYAKLDVRKRTQAVSKARQLGLIS